MVVARLFSGLAEGLAEQAWRPRGIPAIYKLLEGLADDPAIRLVTIFAAKDEHGGRFARASSFHAERLGGTVHILPYRRRRWLAVLGLDNKFREFSHLLRCYRLYRRYRPDVAYFTNANFVPASLFARARLCRTVFRFLGITPAQHKLALARGGLARWLYRAPFDQVVCTLEGSGGTYYLPKLLRPEVPRAILLNGVDPGTPGAGAKRRVREMAPKDGRPVVLFVGKLEWFKGCREFVEAVLRVLASRPGSLRAVLLGEGSLRRELEAAAKQQSALDDVLFAGNVPHDEVPAWLARADIYVSINRWGSLSNANLEALAAGKCMIVLDKDPKTHIDEETEAILPAEAAIRIPRTDTGSHLAAAIETLVDDPKGIAKHGAAAKRFARAHLQSWDARIAGEIALIRNTAEASRP
ncbi:MAG: glycosyltransferase family 4 protein [Alphaproteobacteria bacterium]